MKVVFDGYEEDVIECATVFFVITSCSAKNIPTAKRFLDSYGVYIETGVVDNFVDAGDIFGFGVGTAEVGVMFLRVGTLNVTSFRFY